MISAIEALERLKDGNRRFVERTTRDKGEIDPDVLGRLAEGQEPFAIIFGCSDSRVPGEIVFDQGLGDLFVIRVAGNVVAPSLVGSVEFAAAQFGTKLVVVLGHTQCGAVAATLGELESPTGVRSPNLRDIVDRVRPAVEGLFEEHSGEDRDELLDRMVRANIRASVDQLRHGSGILEDLISNQGLVVVGAEYSLETGEVEYLDA
jgi:carbonic anhydrase